jgi:para-aminobenzoate synthetase / 4-amino-4-deoxychorismate lyase
MAGPMIRLDFPALAGRQPPYLFSAPRRILRADRLEEITAVLAEVEAETRAGRFAVGYIAYEAAPAFDPALRVRTGSTLPLAWFGIFDEPDAPPAVPPAATMAAGEAGPPPADPPAAWHSDTSRAEYDAAIAWIRHGIEAGDFYQVNYAMRLRGEPAAEPAVLYDALRAVQGADKTAFLDIGTHRIISLSPELFFERRGDRIRTRPMKGTARRGLWLEEDQAAAARLAASDKDRAENLMIVDLMRNDLGRIARFGSVHVPRLFDIERYPTLHQMTSTVAASLRPECTLTDIFRALFPSGSVTGAPKVAAMAAIATLERSSRGVYCGAVGIVAPGGDCIFNVAIRTLVEGPDGAEYGVGGGITWDSTAGGEYDEAMTKAAVLAAAHPPFELLETMRLEDGRCQRLPGHLARLRASAEYFGYRFDEIRITTALEAAAAGAVQPARVRLLLDSSGAPRIEITPLDAGERMLRVEVARTPVRRGDRFLYHKTTHRAVYAARRHECPGAADVLLFNEDDELTEFTTGNLILEVDGARYTPPRRSGLLAGVLRQELLDAGALRERVLYLDDLRRATAIWLTNSVRGLVPVRLEGQPPVGTDTPPPASPDRREALA